MFGLVFLLLIVVPVVELYVLFQVAEPLGWLPTVFLLLLISFVGAWWISDVLVMSRCASS